ncbi:MAG: hypothetical protein V3573_02835 [Desulfovibrionaceae bacterium]
MYRTLLVMVLALAGTVLAALGSNECAFTSPLETVRAASALPAPVSEGLFLEVQEQNVMSDAPASDQDIVLSQDKAAALLFMGVLRDN